MILTPAERSIEQKILYLPVIYVCKQVYFFGWGFFALGHDDTLERKLNGQLIESHTLPEEGGGGSPHNESSDALPQQEGRRVEATNSQERAAVGGDRVAIDIEPSTGEISSQAMNTARNDESCGLGGEHSWAGLRKQFLRLLVSPNIIAVTIGVIIAMIPPLQNMLFANPRAILRPFGAALEVRCVLKSS